MLLAAAVMATSISAPTQAWQRSNGTINDAQNLSKRNLIGRAQKGIAAETAPAADDNAVALEFEENLLQELAWNAVLLGDIADDLGVVHARKRNQGPERILRLLRNHWPKGLTKQY